MNSRAYTFCLALPIALLIGCSESKDLVTYKTKDNSFVVGFYKNTAFMTIDDDGVHRLGIRGFEQLDGKKSEIFFGFECDDAGGIYTTIEDDKTDNLETVSFDRIDWIRGGKKFTDHVAEEACKIGELQYAEDSRTSTNDKK